MKTDNLPFAILVAVIVGILQTFLLLFCWAYIAAYVQYPRWFMELGAQGVPLRASVFVLDFLISVALCVPAALVLRRLRPSNWPAYLGAAVIPGFLWQYRLFFQDLSAIHEFAQFVPGIVSTLFVVPAAVVLTRAFRRAHA